MRLTCPPPQPFPPLPPKAPKFVAIEVDTKKFDTYRPAVHLHWQMDLNDSLDITEYIILKKMPLDSNFNVLVRGIPDSVFDFYEPLDNIILPEELSFKSVLYRIFAKDNYGRSGDTSNIDSIVLLWPPILLTDTLKNDNVLRWSVSSIQAGFFNYIYLINDSSGLIWKSPKPDTPSYLTDGQIAVFSEKINSSFLPLLKGNCFWAVKIEAPALKAESMELRKLYVP
jgi:hypothetical protein